MSVRFLPRSSRSARADEVLWHQAFGRLDYDPDSAPTQNSTIFDLASLTKVIATTSLVMRLVERGALALDHPIRRWIPEWRGNDREDVTRARAPDTQLRA